MLTDVRRAASTVSHFIVDCAVLPCIQHTTTVKDAGFPGPSVGLAIFIANPSPNSSALATDGFDSRRWRHDASSDYSFTSAVLPGRSNFPTTPRHDCPTSCVAGWVLGSGFNHPDATAAQCRILADARCPVHAPSLTISISVGPGNPIALRN